MSQLKMIRPNLDKLLKIQIPKGYGIRTYEPGDEVHWARIINDSFGGDRSAEDARKKIMAKPQFIPEGLFFATYQGEPVGTACAWRQSPDEMEVGCVHMVGVVSEHQGHRLGKLVCLRVLYFFKEHGFSMAILSTDDHIDRLPAVKTYLNIGFKPLYRDDSHPERWRVVCEKLGVEAPETLWENDIKYT